MIVDTYKHKGLRNKLILELQNKGISDQKVLNVMNQIPRHLFFDNSLEAHAYIDKAFPIGNGQTISQPFTVAQQTSLLNLKPTDKILEIGTGCGYQTSILTKLSKSVTSVERIKSLHFLAKKNLKTLNIKNTQLVCGDGTLGHLPYAPYDKIIVTAGAPVLPENLFSQLSIGGHIIIPIGEFEYEMFRFTKTAEKKFSKENFGKCAFVPLIGQKGWKK